MSTPKPRFMSAAAIMAYQQTERDLERRASNLRQSIVELANTPGAGGYSSQECRAAVKALSLCNRELKTLRKPNRDPQA